MNTENKQISLSVPEEVIKSLDSNVVAIVGAKNVDGFKKAYMVSDAIGKMKEVLTPKYMAPIMNLQGNRLGFKTDKDTKGGYSEAEVKNCLIEAVLIGLQPVGNHFNIIAGNMYPTKEGFGYLLDNTHGLSYEIIPELPRIKADNSGAAIVMNIKWSFHGGATQTRAIDFPIKMNNFMGTDAVIGKATRKARAWLFNNLNGTEIPDGDVQDVEGRVVGSKLNTEIIDYDDLKTLLEFKQHLLSKEDAANAQRIIDNKEVTSYPKLFKTLQSL